MSSLQATPGHEVLANTTATRMADKRGSSAHVILRKLYRKVGLPKS